MFPHISPSLSYTYVHYHSAHIILPQIPQVQDQGGSLLDELQSLGKSYLYMMRHGMHREAVSTWLLFALNIPSSFVIASYMWGMDSIHPPTHISTPPYGHCIRFILTPHPHSTPIYTHTYIHTHTHTYSLSTSFYFSLYLSVYIYIYIFLSVYIYLFVSFFFSPFSFQRSSAERQSSSSGVSGVSLHLLFATNSSLL